MEKSPQNYQAHFAIPNGVNVSVFAPTLDFLSDAVRKIHAAVAPNSTPTVINVADNPATGAPLVPPPPPGQIEQAAAAASFGKGTPLTPEQMIAAHAASVAAAPPPAPTISAAAAVPGGAAAAATVSPPPPAQAGEVDSRGIRWDPRIHSSTRTRIANGEWRTKKGVPDGLKEQVEAEQRALAAIPPAPNGAVVPAPAPVAPPAPQAAAPAVPPPPVTAPAATPPAPPPVIDAAGPKTFNDLCNWLNGPMLANPPKLTLDEVNAEVKRHGFDNLSALLTRDDYVPVVHAALAALAASR